MEQGEVEVYVEFSLEQLETVENELEDELEGLVLWYD